MMLEGNRFIVIGGHIKYMRASRVQVEYSAIVCNHNYSHVCKSVISRVYIPASNILVLREKATQQLLRYIARRHHIRG